MSLTKEQIEILKPIQNVESVNLYQKETVEHIVDQLIKLNQEMNRKEYPNSGIIYKEEIKKAMESLNEALKYALMTKLVLK